MMKRCKMKHEMVCTQCKAWTWMKRVKTDPAIRGWEKVLFKCPECGHEVQARMKKNSLTKGS